ncbi:hypothetical protein EMCRGX_G026652 [Ephydatia muelleri]
MVTKTYSAHVCDLGVARIQEKLATIRTSKGTGAGTIPYKAPEMFTSAKQSTPVDMYSFGCLLIELLTEKKVWGDLDGCQITAKLCGSFQTPPEQPSVTDVPKEYKDLCTQLTRIVPSERPTALLALQQLSQIDK